MPVLDLGCGSNKQGDVGIDIAPWPGVDHVLRLGFDVIPYPDCYFDNAKSVHSIEHIPFCLWTPTGERSYPMVQFLSEVHRVLKPGAQFEILTLPYPDPRCFQDPTHVSIWTIDTIRHFVGARESDVGDQNDEMAGLHTPFRLIRSGLTTDKLLEIILQKP